MYYAMGGAFRIIGGDDAGLYFRHTDHLGSTSVLSDSNGLKVAGSEVVYAPFGEIREGEQPDLTDFGFTGQRLDGSTGGLMFYQSRYYLPGLKRFISPDTIVPGAANPQAFNRYSYTLNNPLNFIDPTGHLAKWMSWSGIDEVIEQSGATNWWPASEPVPIGPAPQWIPDDSGGSWDVGGDDDVTAQSPLMGVTLQQLLESDVDIAGNQTNGHMTDWYGNPNYGSTGNPRSEAHTGIDFTASSGDPIAPILPGTIAGLNTNSLNPYGIAVIIETPYDTLPDELREQYAVQEGESLYILYAHLDSTTLTVDQATSEALIQQEDSIGAVGATGSGAGDAAHLHVETRTGQAGLDLGAFGSSGTQEQIGSFRIFRELDVDNPKGLWS